MGWTYLASEEVVKLRRYESIESQLISKIRNEKLVRNNSGNTVELDFTVGGRRRQPQ